MRHSIARAPIALSECGARDADFMVTGSGDERGLNGWQYPDAARSSNER
jgi:hypothetical protein